MLRLMEWLTAVTGVLFFACGVGIITGLDTGPGAVQTSEDGYILIQIGAAAYYFAAGGLLLFRFPVLLKAVRTHWILVALSLFALSTTFWSVNPDVTLRRGIGIVGTTLFAFFLHIRFSRRECLEFLALGLGTAAVLSYLVVLVNPDVGIMDDKHLGSWRGFYSHKNNLGWAMVVASAVFYSMARRRGYLSIPGLFLVLSSLLVFLSGSRTSWVVYVLLLLVVPVFRVLRYSPRAMLGLLTALAGVALVAALLAIGHYESLLNAMGREATLTGRTTVWLLAIEQGLNHLWTGSGYGAFWLGQSGASFTIWETLGWEAPHGHNSYLDVWLELGLVGLFTLIAVFVRYAPATTRMIRSGDDDAQGIGLIILGVALLGLSADIILKQNNILWIAFILAVMYATAESTDDTAQSVGEPEVVDAVPGSGDVREGVIGGERDLNS